MKLYKVVFVNQETGDELTRFTLAKNIGEIEKDYADIVSIKPVVNFKVICLED